MSHVHSILPSERILWGNKILKEELDKMEGVLFDHCAMQIQCAIGKRPKLKRKSEQSRENES